MKILLISGHGAGDPGACSGVYKEADLTRQATYLLEGKLNAYDCKVTRYPTSRNAYADNKNGKNINWTEYGLVVEVHFNSYNKTAKGTETLYKPDNMKSLAVKITDSIAANGFVNRGAKHRLDLLNMNTCARLGVPYVLIETCFIDSKTDMDTYNAKINNIWYGVAHVIANYYKIPKYNGGGDAVKNGWIRENGTWHYYNKGVMVKDAWRKDSTGKWCYLDKNGDQAKSRWVKYKDNWYYIKPDGYMADGEWVNWKDGWYYLKQGGEMATGTLNFIHKFDKDGKCVK